MTNTTPAHFRHGERDGEAMLLVSGEVDLAASPKFVEHLDILIGAAHSPGLVDLSGVSFLDCAGLENLVQAKARAEASGVSLVLVAPSRSTRRLIDLAGLTSHFEIRN